MFKLVCKTFVLSSAASLGWTTGQVVYRVLGTYADRYNKRHDARKVTNA